LKVGSGPEFQVTGIDELYGAGLRCTIQYWCIIRR